ncbi:MAG: quinone-dependent dihydroorotate dehydrogenase [Microscillaceae bacterium]|nr:quinone-dependent dihydroorotate dehydrogenase [Microscillaceae bacterium]
MYKFLIQPILFLLEAEKAHRFTAFCLKTAFRIPGIKALCRWSFSFEHPSLEKEVFGLRFKNPIGLAAGFDKDAELINELSCFGFGFIEIGTLTPKPQAGNPKPRLFRLKKDQALINRMGFNNKGVENAVARLQKRQSKLIIGGNIGKNKNTPNDEALSDYLQAFETLYPWVDYFTVNVSSPNTPGLRALQEKEPLLALLHALQEKNLQKTKPKPILLKIAPDLSNEQLDEIIEVVLSSQIAGVIATNTTIQRENLQTPAKLIEKIGSGGLSGQVLKDRSTEVIRYLKENSQGAFPIIGVGGINAPEDALEKLKAGASLVQIYTGFVYQGPAFVKRITRFLARSV